MDIFSTDSIGERVLGYLYERPLTFSEDLLSSASGISSPAGSDSSETTSTPEGPRGTLVPGVWQHLCFTVAGGPDEDNSTVTAYLGGKASLDRTMGIFLLRNSHQRYVTKLSFSELGNRPINSI